MNENLIFEIVYLIKKYRRNHRLRITTQAFKLTESDCTDQARNALLLHNKYVRKSTKSVHVPYVFIDNGKLDITYRYAIRSVCKNIIYWYYLSDPTTAVTRQQPSTGNEGNASSSIQQKDVDHVDHRPRDPFHCAREKVEWGRTRRHTCCVG